MESTADTPDSNMEVEAESDAISDTEVEVEQNGGTPFDIGEPSEEPIDATDSNGSEGDTPAESTESAAKTDALAVDLVSFDISIESNRTPKSFMAERQAEQEKTPRRLSFHVNEAQRLTKNRHTSVRSLARGYEAGTWGGVEVEESRRKVEAEGRALLNEMVKLSDELKGRCVGRNKDDARDVYEGLVELCKQWEAREGHIVGIRKEADEAIAFFEKAAAEADQGFVAEMQQQVEAQVADITAQAEKEMEATQHAVEEMREKCAADVAAAKEEAERMVLEAAEAKEAAELVRREGAEASKRAAADVARAEQLSAELGASSSEQEKLSELQKMLAQAEADAKEAKHEIVVAAEEAATARAEAAQAREAASTAAADVEAAQEEAAVARGEAAVARGEAATARANAESTAAAAEGSAAAFTEQNHQLEAQVGELEREVGVLREAAAAAEARSEEALLEALQKASDQAQAQAQARLEEVTAALQEEHQQQVAALQEQLGRVRDRSATLEEDAAAAEARAREVAAAADARVQEAEAAAQGAAQEAQAAPDPAAVQEREAALLEASRQAQEEREQAVKAMQTYSQSLEEKEKALEEKEKALQRERRNSQIIQEKANEYAREVDNARRIQDMHRTSEQRLISEDLTSARQELEKVKEDLEAKKRECKTMRRQMTDLSVFADGGAAVEGPVQTSITLSGDPMLGHTLRVVGAGALAVNCSAQWHRVSPDGTIDIIAGATRVQYAPEPRDVGYLLGCTLTPPLGGKAMVAGTEKLIDMSPGLADYVNMLMARGGGEFNVVIVQLNGAMQDRRSVYQLEVLQSKLKIKRSGRTKYKENYHAKMQVCGARGGGDAAAQGLFLALTPSLVFMLASESSRERNAAIMLIRKFSQQNGIYLKGPEQSAAAGAGAAPGAAGGTPRDRPAPGTDRDSPPQGSVQSGTPSSTGSV